MSKIQSTIANTNSAIPLGFTGRLVTVEGDLSQGLPAFNIVGLGSKTISEARERVKSALKSSGFSFPDRRVTINLAPAELTKDGSHLDLPIALVILALDRSLRQSDLEQRLFAGELALDGSLRPVRGIINIVETARDAGIREAFVPLANLSQAQLVPGIQVYGVRSLQELFLHLKNQQPIVNSPVVVKNTKTGVTGPVLDHIRGQDFAKRALSIAIAGHHNILIFGPPGAGKSMLAKAGLNLLPPLTSEERIAITKLHSIGDLTEEIAEQRPFRAPHYSASAISILGGGQNANPGEVSLAHLGVLFLDELPEYPRSILEALRVPLEDKTITISRAHHKCHYPADFMLIATMNPCPCGYAGDPQHKCRCSAREIINYRNKLSGPLLDRIDICIEVKRPANSDLLKPSSKAHAEHDVVKNKIAQAAKLQRARYGCCNLYNASLSSHQVSAQIPLSDEVKALLNSAADRLNLSARAYFKIIKVARTIADFEQTEFITPAQLAEALSYRLNFPEIV